MRANVLIMATACILLGCTSSPPSRPVATLDSLQEKAIYAVLKKEQLPLPEITPYDSDARQREVFDQGFRAGWECAISGALLHGTFGTPTDLLEDMRDVWSAGWKSGARVGSDRWLAEFQKRREEIGQQDGPANGSQPIGSETNPTSPAAGSRR